MGNFVVPGRKTWAHWEWRDHMARKIAETLDMERFGVRGIYLFGSTADGEAGVGSDIDLLVHFDGGAEQRFLLEAWLDGWSLALAQCNFLLTGYDAGKMLDVHVVTDADIARKDPFAIRIGSVTDPVCVLRLRE